MPEVVGDAAITVDPHDVHALAEAMQRVATDEGPVCHSGKQGGPVPHAFTWERAATMTRAVYEHAVLDKGGGV